MKIKGFMIIDPAGNSIIVPPKDKDFDELMKGRDIRTVKRHKTVAELITDVRKYIKEPEIEI